MKITFVHRLFLYGAVLAYIILDLHTCRGPLRRAIDNRKLDSEQSLQNARQSGLAAVVLGRPITTSQIERTCQERAWLEGKSWDTIPASARKIYRMAALNELIDHQLMRSKIKANDSNINIDPALTEQRWQEFTARFTSKEEMEKLLNSQGINGEKEMRLRIEASLMQDEFIGRQLQPLLTVTDEEINNFYELHKDALAIPERLHLRHVFWATLEKDPTQVKTQAEAALAALTAKQKTLEQLATEQSEDENSKTRGGNLGWLTAARTPADLYLPASSLAPNQPTLIQTKLGWHLVELLEKRPPTPRTIDQCREEIRTTLVDIKRKPALDNIRAATRQTHQAHIHIYQPVIDEMP